MIFNIFYLVLFLFTRHGLQFSLSTSDNHKSFNNWNMIIFIIIFTKQRFIFFFFLSFIFFHKLDIFGFFGFTRIINNISRSVFLNINIFKTKFVNSNATNTLEKLRSGQKFNHFRPHSIIFLTIPKPFKNILFYF